MLKIKPDLNLVLICKFMLIDLPASYFYLHFTYIIYVAIYYIYVHILIKRIGNNNLKLVSELRKNGNHSGH